MMQKILVGLITSCILYGISILVMIHGWGLEPKSWGWILGGSIVAVFLAAMIKVMLEEE